MSINHSGILHLSQVLASSGQVSVSSSPLTELAADLLLFFLPSMGVLVGVGLSFPLGWEARCKMAEPWNIIRDVGWTCWLKYSGASLKLPPLRVGLFAHIKKAEPWNIMRGEINISCQEYTTLKHYQGHVNFECSRIPQRPSHQGGFKWKVVSQISSGQWVANIEFKYNDHLI